MTYSNYVWNASAGECFDYIAYQVYGDERFAAELMQANPALTDKLVFTGGEVIRLPQITVTESYQEGLAAFSAPWK